MRLSRILAAALIPITVLSSCAKEEIIKSGSFTDEIANEEVQLYLDQSGYTINTISVQLAPEGFLIEP